MPDKRRVVVADDEALARQSLCRLIAATDWLECVGEAADGIEAIELIERLEPDLLFLDIRMPRMTGIAVVEHLRSSIPVIFTTAYDDYALAAFELGAIDYLQKPFTELRFRKAVDRARERSMISANTNGEDGADLRERISFALNTPSPLDRVYVRVRDEVIPLRLENVSRIDADGDYVGIYCDGRRYLLYMKVGELANRLDPSRFVRVHRSHIINLDFVAAMCPSANNRLEIRMKDGSRVCASVNGSKSLRLRWR